MSQIFKSQKTLVAGSPAANFKGLLIPTARQTIARGDANNTWKAGLLPPSERPAADTKFADLAYAPET